MKSIVNFIIESGISLTLLSVIYMLFLRRETFFRTNRLFLLASVLFSVMLPFVRLRILNPKPVMLSEITVTPYRNLLETITVSGHGISSNIESAVLSNKLLIAIYLSGVFVLLGLFLFRLIQVAWIIRKNQVIRMNGYKMVYLDSELTPYSFLNYVFVAKNMQQSEGYNRMLSHELEHVKQGHSIDVIILEVLTAFQWFNPFMWMLRHAIRENHEYLADQAVIAAGTRRGEYKLLLLNQMVGGQLIITNNFNYSMIKNRIKMISKIKSSKLATTKITLGVLVVVALIIAFACEQKESKITQSENISVVSTILPDGKIKIEGTTENLNKYKLLFEKSKEFQIITDSVGVNYLIEKEEPINHLNENEEVFFIVEEMPEYPGGEMALRNFIAQNVKYPEQAAKKGIKGKVYVTFVVGTDGNVKSAKIARGVDPLLDAEALRVVSNLNGWKPGKQKGVPVNVSYTVPINFALQ